MGSKYTSKKVGISSGRTLGISLGIVTLFYVILISNSFFLLLPNGYYDDGLQFRLAQSLTNGHWLGKYDSITLAKGVAYPMWLAFLHMLDVPLWLGNAALYILACLSFVFVVRQMITRTWILVALYGFILFNPMLSPRIYRDSIAPAIGMLVVSWILGMFLAVTGYRNAKEGSSHKLEMVIYTIIGSISLPIWWYLREDYFWLLPLVISGCVMSIGIVLIHVIKRRQKYQYLLKIAGLLAIPFLSVLVVGIVIASFNKHYYGRFVVNDYTSSDFAAAYGALTRIGDHDRPITVPVSKTMRQKAYAASPLFRSLKPCLDNGGYGRCEFFKESGTNNLHDYEGGWFFWALRLAVDKEGYYKNAAMAQSFYIKLAVQINKACDNGEITCSPIKRASLTPKFEKRDISPTINNTKIAAKFLYALEFPPDEESIVGHDVYSPEKQVMANYLLVRYRQDQMTPGASVKRRVEHYVARLYQLVNPVLMLLTVIVLITETIFIKKFRQYWRQLLIGWGLILTLLIRVVMLAYVQTTSFPAINNLYFSSSYPLMFCLEGLVVGFILQYVLLKQESKLLGNIRARIFKKTGF